MNNNRNFRAATLTGMYFALLYEHAEDVKGVNLESQSSWDAWAYILILAYTCLWDFLFSLFQWKMCFPYQKKKEKETSEVKRFLLVMYGPC